MSKPDFDNTAFRTRLVDLKDQLAAMSDLISGLVQQYDKGEFEFVAKQIGYEAEEFERFQIMAERISTGMKGRLKKSA